ncbi:hypothetical protein ACJIZ3_001317 [Penstemon smallii]|uniref:BHLH domain-containing protein n=1 Tax=Penstemon smallii TaxID=265156 RepID=A0ABD3U385_9LAMI
MLVMAEGLGVGNLLWEEGQSWALPNSEIGEGVGGKKLETNNNQEGKVVIKHDDFKEPPVPAAKGKNKKKRSSAADKGKEKKGGGGGGEDPDHELHIWTERERRKKMRNMFSGLHALLPHLPKKADKSSIVSEAVQEIKKLEQTVEELEKKKIEKLHGVHQKQSREAFLADQVSAMNNSNNSVPNQLEFPAVFKTWATQNVILSVSGRDAHINVCGPKKPGLLTALLFVLEKYKLDVVSAQVSSDPHRFMYMIHTSASGVHQFSQAFLLEEMYKQVTAEIMLYVG